jgi:hypothetical protein
MRIDELPFLHFMVRLGSGRKSWFVSPLDIQEDTIPGGCFTAPVSGGGRLFPAYRFHFSIYRSAGNYLEKRGSKLIFNGVAITSESHKKHNLLLTFDGSNGDPWRPGPFPGNLPATVKHHEELLLPMLRRVQGQASRPYRGSLRHRDFRLRFAELEYDDLKVFENLFDYYGISIIGCDPQSEYAEVPVH